MKLTFPLFSLKLNIPEVNTLGDEAKPFPVATEPLTATKGVAWGRPRGPGGLEVAAYPRGGSRAQEMALPSEQGLPGTCGANSAPWVSLHCFYGVLDNKQKEQCVQKRSTPALKRKATSQKLRLASMLERNSR